MAFNKLNSVEHYIIHQLSGVNLNNDGVAEPEDGFKIPDDISILGFTSGFLGEFINPSLSTIDHQGKEQGLLAVDLILDRIEGILPNEPLELTLRGVFLLRDSIRKTCVMK